MWYAALIYLKQNSTEKSEKYLNDIVDKQAWNHKKAQKLLQQ